MHLLRVSANPHLANILKKKPFWFPRKQSWPHLHHQYHPLKSENLKITKQIPQNERKKKKKKVILAKQEYFMAGERNSNAPI